MTSIAGDRGRVETESVVIRLIMEAISYRGKGADGEQAMVGGEGTERTNATDGVEVSTEEEEQG